MPFADLVRRSSIFAMMALMCLTVAAHAGITTDLSPKSELQAALERAIAQYRIALDAVENGSQQAAAVEVHRFREIWHHATERYRAQHPAQAERLGADMVDVDLRIVGVLLIIDMGRREAARTSLISIEDTLEKLERDADTR